MPYALTQSLYNSTIAGAGSVQRVQRKLCNLSGVAVQSPQPPYGNHTEPVRFRAEAAWKWCGDRGATMPYFSVWSLCGARAGIVRCHLWHIYGLRTYDFSNLYNFPLNKIVEATEPLNPYKNLTATFCLCKEASPRPHGKGDTRRRWKVLSKQSIGGANHCSQTIACPSNALSPQRLPTPLGIRAGYGLLRTIASQMWTRHWLCFWSASFRGFSFTPYQRQW